MSTITTAVATGSPAIRHETIDDCLGPAATRFFGQGFRRVGQALGDLEVRPAPAGGEVAATAEVRYPDGWSVRDARDAPRPHLSTVDALTIGVQAAEAYLVHTYALTEQDRRRMWLRKYTMRAGTKPQEDLAAVPVHGTALYTVPALGGLGHAVTAFEVAVGVMRVRFDVEHDVRERSEAVGKWDDAQDLLGNAEDRYYGQGFLRRPQSITDVAVDTATGGVTGLVRVGAAAVLTGTEAAPGRDIIGHGFAADYEPALSMVDGIVALAQLAQAAMYGLDGVERKQTGTLWMRRLAMSAPTPYQPLANAFVSSLTVEGKRLERSGVSWRMYEVDAAFQGISASASLAYTVHA